MGRCLSRMNSLSRMKVLALLACIFAALALAACGSSGSSGSGSTSASGSSTTPKKLKVPVKMAAIYLAKFNSEEYGRAYLNSFETLKQKYGIDVKLVEDVPYNAQMTQATTQLLQQGYNVVLDTVAAGKLFYQACAKFPKAHCIEQTPPPGVTMPANTVGQNQDQFSPIYLQGIAAGLLTKSGTIGMVNPYKVPNIQSGLNAYALGCQSVKPDCKVRNIYVNDYFKPPASIEAANTLIDAGADVINHWQDDQSAMTAALRKGVWSFGTYVPPSAPLDDKYVTTPEWSKSLQSSISQIVDSIQNGTFSDLRQKTLPAGVYGTPKPVDIPLAPWGPKIPADVKAKVEAVSKQMNSGESPIKGPIYDANGKLRIPAGKTIDLRDPKLTQQWNYPVKGVIGG